MAFQRWDNNPVIVNLKLHQVSINLPWWSRRISIYFTGGVPGASIWSICVGEERGACRDWHARYSRMTHDRNDRNETCHYNHHDISPGNFTNISKPVDLLTITMIIFKQFVSPNTDYISQVLRDQTRAITNHRYQTDLHSWLSQMILVSSI